MHFYFLWFFKVKNDFFLNYYWKLKYLYDTVVRSIAENSQFILMLFM